MVLSCERQASASASAAACERVDVDDGRGNLVVVYADLNAAAVLVRLHSISAHVVELPLHHGNQVIVDMLEDVFGRNLIEVRQLLHAGVNVRIGDRHIVENHVLLGIAIIHSDVQFKHKKKLLSWTAFYAARQAVEPVGRTLS